MIGVPGTSGARPLAPARLQALIGRPLEMAISAANCEGKQRKFVISRPTGSIFIVSIVSTGFMGCAVGNQRQEYFS